MGAFTNRQTNRNWFCLKRESTHRPWPIQKSHLNSESTLSPSLCVYTQNWRLQFERLLLNLWLYIFLLSSHTCIFEFVWVYLGERWNAIYFFFGAWNDSSSWISLNIHRALTTDIILKLSLLIRHDCMAAINNNTYRQKTRKENIFKFGNWFSQKILHDNWQTDWSSKNTSIKVKW